MRGFVDLGEFNEDRRIDLIGKAVMNGTQTSADKPNMIGFIVETDEKANRYLEKLRGKFPGIREIDRHPGPVASTILVRIAGPPPKELIWRPPMA